MFASRTLQIFGVKLFFLPVCAVSAVLAVNETGPSKPGDPLNAPLFVYKAELAEDGQPYLHITPEAVILYFRSLKLKSLSVTSLDYCHPHPLEKSRVLSWNPRPGGPIVVIEEEARDAVLERMGERLALNEVPETFSIVLEDGAIIVITPDESLRRKFRHFRSLEEEEKFPVVFIQMPVDAARQLFWHLQEEMGVIY